MTNANVTVERLSENGLVSSSGYKIGVISSGAKVAQNDTWTVLNVDEIVYINITDDSTGVVDANTISSNVVTLTNASTGAATGFIVYK